MITPVCRCRTRCVARAAWTSRAQLFGLLLGVLGAWLSLGCSSNKGTTAPTPSVNGDKPNANTRVTTQSFLGDASKRTQFWTVQRADDGSYAFWGQLDGPAGVGALNTTGSLRWFKVPNYSARAIQVLPASSVVPHGLLVIGAQDTDSDGSLNVGWASLYAHDGSLLSQVLMSSATSQVWFSDVYPINDSAFVACGGETQGGGISHPLVAILKLRPPGLCVIEARVSVSTIVGVFNDITVLPATPGELTFSTTSRNGDTRSLHGLRAPWPAFDPVTVDWSVGVVPPSGQTWAGLYDLGQSAGNLYVTGEVNDTGKTPAPSNGGSWISGLVASYTGAGTPRWVKTIAVTKHSDRLHAIAFAPDAVYAVGDAATFFRGDPADEFGYGLISKLDPNTGEVLANFTVGDDTYSAGFWSAQWTAGGMICGGWSDFEVSGGPFVGWLTTVNTSGTSVTESPVPMGSGGSAGRGGMERQP